MCHSERSGVIFIYSKAETNTELTSRILFGLTYRHETHVHRSKCSSVSVPDEEDLLYRQPKLITPYFKHIIAILNGGLCLK